MHINLQNTEAKIQFISLSTINDINNMVKLKKKKSGSGSDLNSK